MEKSYNGWTASPTPSAIGITPLVVGGESFSPGVRGGDVHDVFQYLAEQLNARVEPIVRPDWHQADDWGYSYRKNVNANNLSCHASGTAIDYNATRHPNNKSGTFSAGQVKTIRDILRDMRGVITWGGDFSGVKDEMHWEIAKNAAAVADLASSIRAERAGGAVKQPTVAVAPVSLGSGSHAPVRLPVLSMDARATQNHGFVDLLQQCLGLKNDGDYGPATRDAVLAIQRKYHHASIDGVAGNWTWVAFLADLGTIHRGDYKGHPAIEVLQNMLGFSGAELDRDFGASTQARICEVQRWGNVSVDGAVGEDTRNVLARA